MFGSNQSGAKAYSSVGVETGVLAASPHKLIAMLYDGALASVSTAALHMKEKNILAKGKAISKTIDIIENGLRASLDKKVGGDLALSLDGLYEYMTSRLLLANLHNDAGKLEEVRQLLSDLKGAWAAIEPKGATQPAAGANTQSVAPAAQASPGVQTLQMPKTAPLARYAEAAKL